LFENITANIDVMVDFFSVQVDLPEVTRARSDAEMFHCRCREKLHRDAVTAVTLTL